ncbi:hypothetical protein [Streptomyces sp. NPDC001678]|uniref:hypothetical protein n=1 Tax=Streptomyces sp. NPDC001678 TaxID=3364599 RepID=UPI0036C0D742
MASEAWTRADLTVTGAGSPGTECVDQWDGAEPGHGWEGTFGPRLDRTAPGAKAPGWPNLG